MELVNTEQLSTEDSGYTATDGLPWYAIRLFGNCQARADEFFRDKGVVTFIPMNFRDYVDEEGKHRRKLKPVVSNLLFVKKTITAKAMNEIISQSQLKMSVLTKSRENREYYEIPAKQMHEFQVMCNPEMEMRKYLSAEEAKLKAGTPVQVLHGPLKGLTGRLVRQSHKYYLLKEIPGIGVMLKVSRWCCKPLSEIK
jgi:transcription antitermination factor NusG